MNLRPYQTRAIDDLRATYQRGSRAPVLVLPTGGGKTVIAAEIIRSAVSLGRRVLFLAHRRELIDQAARKLAAAGIHDVRTIQAASDLGSRRAPVTVASVPTLTKWQTMPPADLVVFDECHHVVAKTWRKIADAYGLSRLLGLTATPQRSDGSPLGDVFDALVVGSTVAELTDAGHLVRCRTFAPPNVLDTARVALTPAEAYAQFGEGRRGVVFCSTRDEAAAIAGTIPGAAVVHGAMPTGKRAAALKTARVLVNVHVLTEGWDDPECSICILARKPQHAGTYLQMVGRVLRPAPGKPYATVVDLCGSSLVHGTADTPRAFTLDGGGIRRTDDREPIRQCPSCGAVFVSAQQCPECGRTFQAKQRAELRSTGVGVQELGAQTPPRPMQARVIESKFPGTCRVCSGAVYVGARIAWAKGAAPAHEMCWVNELMAGAA
jgi:DNA repair protein RadD